MAQELNDTRSHLSSVIPYVDRKLRMLEGTARVLSSNYDVTITFSTEGECRTHFDQMVLPYHELVDEVLSMSLMGHEVGHLIGEVEIEDEKHSGTDFSIGRIVSRKRDILDRVLLFHIVNSLEDARIEFIMEYLYPGFIEMFKKLTPYIKKRKKKIMDEMSEIQRILDVIYLLLRRQDPEIYPEKTVVFVYNFLMPTAERVYECKNTRETLEVALEIYYILTKEKGEQMAKELMKRNLEQQKNKCESCNDDCNVCTVPEFLKPQKQDRSVNDQNKKRCPKCGRLMNSDEEDNNNNDEDKNTSEQPQQVEDNKENNDENKNMSGQSQQSDDDKEEDNNEVKTQRKCDYCGGEDIRRFYVGQKIKHFRTNEKGKVVSVKEGKTIEVGVEY